MRAAGWSHEGSRGAATEEYVDQAWQHQGKVAEQLFGRVSKAVV